MGSNKVKTAVQWFRIPNFLVMVIQFTILFSSFYNVANRCSTCKLFIIICNFCFHVFSMLSIYIYPTPLQIVECNTRSWGVQLVWIQIILLRDRLPYSGDFIYTIHLSWCIGMGRQWCFLWVHGGFRVFQHQTPSPKWPSWHRSNSNSHPGKRTINPTICTHMRKYKSMPLSKNINC